MGPGSLAGLSISSETLKESNIETRSLLFENRVRGVHCSVGQRHMDHVRRENAAVAYNARQHNYNSTVRRSVAPSRLANAKLR